MRLLETTYKIRTDSEAEAKKQIEHYQALAAEEGYVVKKCTYEYKSKKAKGEIIDEAWIVTVVNSFGSIWED